MPRRTARHHRSQLPAALLSALFGLSAMPTASAQAAVCGNGTVETGEVCDDGTALNGTPNHCALGCLGATPSVCGNRVVEAGETCDDGGDQLLCDVDCTPAACGDGYVNPVAHEECDDGAENGTGRTVCGGHCERERPVGQMNGGSCALTPAGRHSEAGLLGLGVFGLVLSWRSRGRARLGRGGFLRVR